MVRSSKKRTCEEERVLSVYVNFSLHDVLEGKEKGGRDEMLVGHKREGG